MKQSHRSTKPPTQKNDQSHTPSRAFSSWPRCRCKLRATSRPISSLSASMRLELTADSSVWIKDESACSSRERTSSSCHQIHCQVEWIKERVKENNNKVCWLPLDEMLGVLPMAPWPWQNLASARRMYCGRFSIAVAFWISD